MNFVVVLLHSKFRTEGWLMVSGTHEQSSVTQRFYLGNRTRYCHNYSKIEKESLLSSSFIHYRKTGTNQTVSMTTLTTVVLGLGEVDKTDNIKQIKSAYSCSCSKNCNAHIY